MRMNVNVIPALAVLCMAWHAHAAPVSGTAVFSPSDEAKVQTLTPQDQERVRKSLAEAQGRGIALQALTLIQQPTFAGTRIDQCLTPGPAPVPETCGDRNATLVCKIAGFRKSFPGGFAVDQSSTTFYLATDSTCSGGPENCGAFTYVICEHP